MTINLFQNNSDCNVVSKSLTAKGTVTGTLREGCSIIDPVIKIEGISGSDLPYLNYLEIVEFGRYYYIRDIVLVGKLFEVHCHIACYHCKTGKGIQSLFTRRSVKRICKSAY